MEEKKRKTQNKINKYTLSMCNETELIIIIIELNFAENCEVCESDCNTWLLPSQLHHKNNVCNVFMP